MDVVDLWVSRVPTYDDDVIFGTPRNEHVLANSLGVLLVPGIRES